MAQPLKFDGVTYNTKVKDDVPWDARSFYMYIKMIMLLHKILRECS